MVDITADYRYFGSRRKPLTREKVKESILMILTGVCAMKRFLSTLVVLCGIFLIQCETSTTSSCRFVIWSAGAPCSGIYMVDSGDAVAFNVSEYMSGSKYYYSFTKDLDSPKSIIIRVNSSAKVSATIDGSSAVADSITVYIYQDDVVVKQSDFSQTATTTSGNYVYSVTGSVSYTFSDSSSTTATTSSK